METSRLCLLERGLPQQPFRCRQARFYAFIQGQPVEVIAAQRQAWLGYQGRLHLLNALAVAHGILRDGAFIAQDFCKAWLWCVRQSKGLS